MARCRRSAARRRPWRAAFVQVAEWIGREGDGYRNERRVARADLEPFIRRLRARRERRHYLARRKRKRRPEDGYHVGGLVRLSSSAPILRSVRAPRISRHRRRVGRQGNGGDSRRTGIHEKFMAMV